MTPKICPKCKGLGGYPRCPECLNSRTAKEKADEPLPRTACSRIRAWRSTVERFVEYQAACSNHGGRPIHALPSRTLTEAIDHCIRWREEGATGTFTVTTRRKDVEEIILCENVKDVATQPAEKAVSKNKQGAG